MRILHVLTHREVKRGGAIQALLLARAQRRRGHEVEIVCDARPGRTLDPSFDRWVAEGVSIRPMYVSAVSDLLRFRRFVKSFRPDVLHVHRDSALLFAWFATRGAGVRAFVAQRGTTHPMRTPIVRHIFRSGVDRVIAVAQAVKDALVRGGVPERRVAVVYGSFDVARFDPAKVSGARVRAELGMADGQPLVVQIGELNRKKAPAKFVRAAHTAAAERPDVVFALVGEGRHDKRCAALARDLGIERNVKLLGFRTDVPELLAAADVVVNSSTDSEGLTGSLREALAMARPIAATRVDGNPELVRDGETGLLVPPRDPAAMARAVLDLIAHPAKGRRMGETGRALVLETMSEDVRVRRVEEVYGEALEESGVRSPEPGGRTA